MANEKRLIAENDVYSLFGENGMARLHVADIDALPRVDAVDVVHGRWLNSHTIAFTEECSICGFCVPWDDYGMQHKYNYCPNCGAKNYNKESDDERN